MLIDDWRAEVYFGEVQQIWSDEHQTLLAGARFDTGSFPTVNTLAKTIQVSQRTLRPMKNSTRAKLR